MLPRVRRRRPGPVRRVITLLAFLTLAGAVGVVGIVSWVAADAAIHPGSHAGYTWHAEEYPQLHPQNVTFVSHQDNTRLAGRFFAGSSSVTLILSHGWGNTQQDMLPWVNFLHKGGFSVFTFDMRATGHSGGDAATLGAREQDDLISAVDYLVKRPDVARNRIGALGVSLGGSTTIMAAARDRRIRAVVDDCGFSDAQSVIDSSFQHFVGLPAFPFALPVVALAQWRTGITVGRIRPVDAIGRIAPRPILIIHGMADTFVPPANSIRNFSAARQPKSIWWVAGAGHAASLAVAGSQYERRVVAFFRHYLTTPTTAAAL